MAYNPFIVQTGNSLQGNNQNLQGSFGGSLQGSQNAVQTPSAPTPAPAVPKKVTYGNTAATSPKQQYINDLSSQYGNVNGTIYNKSTGTGYSNQDDFFRDSGVSNFNNLKFDTGYQPASFSTPSAPVSAPSSSNSLAEANANIPTTPESDPMAAYKKTFQDYIASLAPSADVNAAKQKYLDFVSNAQSGIKALEGQGRGIPLQLVRGQQSKLGSQAEITANRLQDDVGLATENQTALTNQAKARSDYEKNLYDTSKKTQDEQAKFAFDNNISTPFYTIAGTVYRTSDGKPFSTQGEAFGAGVARDYSNAPKIKAPTKPIEVSAGASLVDPKTGLPLYTAPAVPNYQSTPLGQIFDTRSGTFINGESGDAIANLARAIQSGTIKIEDLPPGAITQVAPYLSQITQSQRQQALTSNLTLVNELISNPNIDKISGFFQGKLGLGNLQPSAQLALNQFNQLKGTLSLENREKLKGSGAISDFEFKVLSDAASALNRNLSDSEFKNQLQKIKEVFEGKYNQTLGGTPSTGGNPNDPLGLFSSAGNASASTPYLKTLGKVTGANGSEYWANGLDVDLKKGDPVKSPVSGTVIAAATNGGFGNQVKIKTTDGKEIWLSHLDSGKVKVGQPILAGQIVGIGGNTGRTIPGPGGDGSHLDITIRDSNGKLLSAQQVQSYLSNIYV